LIDIYSAVTAIMQTDRCGILLPTVQPACEKSTVLEPNYVLCVSTTWRSERWPRL